VVGMSTIVLYDAPGAEPLKGDILQALPSGSPLTLAVRASMIVVCLVSRDPLRLSLCPEKLGWAPRLVHNPRPRLLDWCWRSSHSTTGMLESCVSGTLMINQ
jgi:hypothetical protein